MAAASSEATATAAGHWGSRSRRRLSMMQPPPRSPRWCPPRRCPSRNHTHHRSGGAPQPRKVGAPAPAAPLVAKAGAAPSQPPRPSFRCAGARGHRTPPRAWHHHPRRHLNGLELEQPHPPRSPPRPRCRRHRWQRHWGLVAPASVGRGRAGSGKLGQGGASAAAARANSSIRRLPTPCVGLLRRQCPMPLAVQVQGLKGGLKAGAVRRHLNLTCKGQNLPLRLVPSRPCRHHAPQPQPPLLFRHAPCRHRRPAPPPPNRPVVGGAGRPGRFECCADTAATALPPASTQRGLW